MHLNRSFILLFLAFFSVRTAAQEKWSLVRCVEYARANNISVRQTDLQTRFSALTYEQSKKALGPSVSIGTSSAYRLGRSENPTTGVLEDNNFLSVGTNLQAGITLFNWFSKKNTIEANRLSMEADKAATQKMQDDISLNVAVAYLQILLLKEQANIAAVQISQTTAQLENTRKRVAAGLLPELNAAELEAQLARDSSNYVSAKAAVDQQMLQMKALLNLDAGAPFDIETPPVETIPLENLADLQPENVYALALANLPQQRINELRLQSAQKNVAVAKAGLYPTISAFGGLGTNYVHFKPRPIYNQVFTGYSNSGLKVDVGGTLYDVQRPNFNDGTTVLDYFRANSFGKQFKNNFGQNVGISLNIPVLNGGFARSSWERSKLSVKQIELTKEQDNQKLKQDIYRAYTDAAAAMQKFNANKKAVETTSKAYEYAGKRYDLNLLSTYDLINSQNNMLRAKIELLYSRYDYVFKMKLLEFYKGQGLKL